MSVTARLKDELIATPVTKTCCRRSEAATVLRLTGAVLPRRGGANVEAYLDSPAAARRLQNDINEVFGHASAVLRRPDPDAPAGVRYVVRVVDGGAPLADQAGLVDGRGHPVRGLPPQVVAGPGCDAIAAWRAAVVTRGSLSGPGRPAALEALCPSMESAMALAGAARRLGIVAKSREVRGTARAVIRDANMIGALLTRLGAQDALLDWEATRSSPMEHADANRLANFDDANQRRAAAAAATTTARVVRALEILGERTPDHLRSAALLRLEHRDASLEELGRLHRPPITKDTLAGRIRRLLVTADKRAAELGVPDTEEAAAVAAATAAPGDPEGSPAED